MNHRPTRQGRNGRPQFYHNPIAGLSSVIEEFPALEAEREGRYDLDFGI